MAVFDEKQLRQHIKSGEFFRVYLIFGDEAYLKQYYSDLLVKKNVDESFEAFNYEMFQGAGLDLRDVYERASLMPMMSEKRVVAVDDFKLDSLGEKELKTMDEAFSSLPDSTVLIFRQGTVGLSKKTGKKVMALFDKYGAVCELNRRKGMELIKPLISSAKKQDCVLDTSVAQYLVSCVGDDFNVLVNELSKVCHYVGQGEIKKSDIDAVCVKTLDAKVYNLTKALMANDFTKAYEVFDTLLRQKTEPQYILGAIIGSYVDMYRAAVAVYSGRQASELAGSFNYKGREFVLSNAARDCKKIGLDRLRQCLDELSKADMKLKRSYDSGRLVLEQLMVKLLLITAGEKV